MTDNYRIDIYKVILMLAIHELEEIYIGDLTLFQISKEEKENILRNEWEEEKNITIKISKKKEEIEKTNFELEKAEEITRLQASDFNTDYYNCLGETERLIENTAATWADLRNCMA